MTPLPSRRSQAAGPVARPGRSPLRLLVLCAFVGALAASAAVQAADPGLVVRDPWMRAIMPSIPAGGYFTLTNDTAAPRALVGASSPDCGLLMLHQSINDNGQDRMAMVKSVAVPAHGSVKFAPGGYHLMCMSPSKKVVRGQSISVTLRFVDGGAVTTKFPVRGATGK